MAALRSFEKDPLFWKGRRPDFGDVYDMATSPSRLKYVCDFLGDGQAVGGDELVEKVGEVQQAVMRMLRPFAPSEAARAERRRGVTDGICPLWALDSKEPVFLQLGHEEKGHDNRAPGSGLDRGGHTRTRSRTAALAGDHRWSGVRGCGKC